MTAADDPKSSRFLLKAVAFLALIVIIQFYLLGFFYLKFKIIPFFHKDIPAAISNHQENIVKSAYPDVDFTRIYPGISSEDIDRIQRESFGIQYVFWPYVVFKPLPYSGKFVNIRAEGFRQGLTKQPWPPNPKDLNVFVFGGSTTFSYGLPDDKTLVSAIQTELGMKFKGQKVQCYNFGRGYYFSTQERMLFESLLQQGIVPRVAIFIDGLNDFYYFNDWPEMAGSFYNLSSAGAPLDLPGQGMDNKQKVDMVVERMSRNFRMIEAVAHEYGVSTVFIGQPIPFLDYPRNAETYPFIHPFAGHDLSEWGYGFLKNAALKGFFGPRFVWCGDVFSQAHDPMYADSIHYSYEGVKILAQAIVERASSKGLL
jgi:hypothetical protein